MVKPGVDGACQDERVERVAEDVPKPGPFDSGLISGGALADQAHRLPSAAPVVDGDPFAYHADGTPWDDSVPEPVSQEAQDRDYDLKFKRDRANAKRRGTKRKKSDLESRTREMLRNAGYVYGRTETVGFTGLKKDLFGFVDGVAIGVDDVLFVQTTSRDHKADHLRKMATGEFKIGNGTPTPCYPVAKRLIENPSCRLVLVLWDKPDRFWRHEIVDVEIATLDEYRARSRKVGE